PPTPLSTPSLHDALPISHWQNQGVSAIAGIAYPEHFFAMLRDHNIDVMGYGFPDHHHFTKKDLAALDTPLFMTEKDAVKCQDLADRKSTRLNSSHVSISY